MITYTIRTRDGTSWLDLLNEKGEAEEFSTFSWAMVRCKALLDSGQATELEIRGAPSPARVTMNGLGDILVSWR